MKILKTIKPLLLPILPVKESFESDPETPQIILTLEDSKASDGSSCGSVTQLTSRVFASILIPRLDDSSKLEEFSEKVWRAIPQRIDGLQVELRSVEYSTDPETFIGNATLEFSITETFQRGRSRAVDFENIQIFTS